MTPLSRRHVLRGIGTAIALPLLDAMVPTFARAAAPAPRRMIIVYAPSGKIMPHWTPAETGAGFAFPRTLKPIEKFRDDVLVLSGLADNNGNALGDGAGLEAIGHGEPGSQHLARFALVSAATEGDAQLDQGPAVLQAR